MSPYGIAFWAFVSNARRYSKPFPNSYIRRQSNPHPRRTNVKMEVNCCLCLILLPSLSPIDICNNRYFGLFYKAASLQHKLHVAIQICANYMIKLGSHFICPLFGWCVGVTSRILYVVCVCVCVISYEPFFSSTNSRYTIRYDEKCAQLKWNETKQKST